MTTDPAVLRQLAAKILAAAEGSRILDCEIAKALGWHRVEPRFTGNKHGAWIKPEDFIGTYSDGSPIYDGLHGTESYRDPPKWSSSRDDAAALMPEGIWLSMVCDDDGRFVIDIIGYESINTSGADCEARARCAAALLVMAEMGEKK